MEKKEREPVKWKTHDCTCELILTFGSNLNYGL
jgi:hypothetical protein